MRKFFYLYGKTLLALLRRTVSERQFQLAIKNGISQPLSGKEQRKGRRDGNSFVNLWADILS